MLHLSSVQKDPNALLEPSLRSSAKQEPSSLPLDKVHARIALLETSVMESIEKMNKFVRRDSTVWQIPSSLINIHVRQERGATRRDSPMILSVRHAMVVTTASSKDRHPRILSCWLVTTQTVRLARQLPIHTCVLRRHTAQRLLSRPFLVLMGTGPPMKV